MRVMGVDPGLTRCGIALVESGSGRSVTALDVDVVRTPADMDLAERLLAIHNAALAAAQRDVPVRFHTPSEVKAAVTGSGRADKAQVTTMITRILGMQTKPKPADAADALALAICHCWRGPAAERLAQAEARAAAITASRLAEAKASGTAERGRVTR